MSKLYYTKKLPTLYKWESFYSFKISFMPVSSMEQVHFTSSRVSCQCRGYCFIMSSSFVSSSFGNFPFRMCHFTTYLSVINFFNASHLGSVSSESSLFSFGWSSCNFFSASDSKDPSSTPG